MYVEGLKMKVDEQEDEIKKLAEENAMLREVIAAAGIDEAAYIGANPKAPVVGSFHPTPPPTPDFLPGYNTGENSGPYSINCHYFGPSFHPGPNFL